MNIKTWGVKDGLGDRQVTGLHKDSRGFMWLCTPSGLNLFDGYGFRVFTKESDGLPFNWLGRITEDPSGKLWILGSAHHNENNLFIFDPFTKKITSFEEKTGYKEKFRFNFLEKFNDSTLFFGSTTQSFFFTWQPRAGLRKIAYPVKYAVVMTTTAHNTFWLQDNGHQLCEIDMNGKLLRKLHTSRMLQNVTPGVNNTVFHVADPQNKNTYRLTGEVTNNGGEAVIGNTNNSSYHTKFSTGVDSIIYNEGKLIHPAKGIIADLVRDGMVELKSNFSSVLIDYQGTIWMANAYGLYMLTITRSKFRKYFYQDPKTFTLNSYRNIVIDSNRLYAVNEFLGVKSTEKGVTDTSKASTQEASSGFFALAKTGVQTFVGLRNKDLYTVEKGKFNWPKYSVDTGDKFLTTWKMYPVAKDSFLLGTGQGLRWMNVNRPVFVPFTKYNTHTQLERSIVYDIKTDNAGQVWICSVSGLYPYNEDKGIIARYSDADTGKYYLPSKDFNNFCQDKDGIYWLATADGLIKWDRQHNKHQLYNRRSGLSNNMIYAVYDDTMGHLWLTSNFGLMRFDKKTGNVKTYLTDDGLTYNEFNRVSHTRDVDGKLYFGTLNGVTAFDPADFIDKYDTVKNAPLSVSYFEQFNGQTDRLENKSGELMHTGVITLNPGDRFFNINFALLNYKDVLHTTYYWKIDGIDASWNMIREPVLRVSGLPYGKRTLRIKGQGSDGSWGRNELAFAVNVIRPFYLRAWFIIMCIVLVVGAFVFWYRYRLHSLKRENIRLDNMVQEKTRSLKATIRQLELSSNQKNVLMKEIHHRVKNNLQIISTLLSLQLKKTQDHGAKKSIEEGISRISSIALIHHHLYKGDDLTAIELSAFAHELYQQITSVFQKGTQKVVLHNTIPKTLLDIDTALPLGLILNELMTNSYKYAYAENEEGIMKVSLSQEGAQHMLTYADNGPGMPEHYDPADLHSLGMVIIKSLAQQLNGEFSYHRATNSFKILFHDLKTRKSVD